MIDRVNFTVQVTASKLKTYRWITVAFATAYLFANIITINSLLEGPVIYFYIYFLAHNQINSKEIYISSLANIIRRG